MNRTFLSFAILLATTSTVSAQISVSKLKNKVEKTVESATTGSEDPAKKLNKNGADPASSPAAQTIRNYRNEISFASDAVKGKHFDAEDRLEKSKKLLDKIKQEDPNWVDYDKDEALYLELLQLHQKNNEGAIMQKRVENFSYWTNKIEREPWMGFGDVAVISKKNYTELQTYYAQHPEEANYANKVLATGDHFYNDIMPKVRAEALKKQNETLEKTQSFTKENRAKSDYLSKRVTGMFYVKEHIEQLRKSILDCDQALLYYPSDPEFSALKTTMTERISDLENYISSGQLAADEEKRKTMDVDAILMDKPGMKNEALNEVVKRDIEASYGVPQRIVIVSTDWTVRRNEYGIILDKFMNVEIACKGDGVCRLVYGQLVCAYEGAGKYGKAKYYTGNNTVMNCLNISK